MTARTASVAADGGALRRLPGSARGLFSRHLSLLGDDHLVLVRRVGYREIYRRVELADLQAISVTPTSDTRTGAAILGIVALGPTLFAALAGGAWRWFWGIVAGLVLGILAVHLLRGPSCRVHLRTPIGWLEMPSLGRRRLAEIALLTIEERVGGIQGSLGTPEARERYAEVAPALDRSPVVVEAVTGLAAPLRRVTRRWHDLLFALLLGELAISLAQTLAESTPLDLFATIYFLVEVGIAITAVVVQARSDLPRGLRRWALATLVGLAATFVLSAYVGLFATAFSGTPSSAVPMQPLSLSGSTRVVLSIVHLCVVGALLVARLALPRGVPAAPR